MAILEGSNLDFSPFLNSYATNCSQHKFQACLHRKTNCSVAYLSSHMWIIPLHLLNLEHQHGIGTWLLTLKLLILQWNGCPFFPVWTIFGSLCCMFAASNRRWPWQPIAFALWVGRGWIITNSAPTSLSPSYLWASGLFAWGGDVIFSWLPFNIFCIPGYCLWMVRVAWNW